MTAVLSPLGYDTVDIMVDVDDVIVPWFETVDAECRAAFDPDGLLGPCEVWSMWEHYKVPQASWEDCVIKAVQTGLYHTVDPFPYAVEAINRLRWFGHRIHIVTARGFMANGDNIREWTPAYLERFGVGYSTLTFAKDKLQAMSDLNCVFDYAIDDGGHNYDVLADGGINVWLQEAPHNKQHRASQRVSSLWDFSEMILEETVPAHLLMEATA